jgi:hypothetical protein
LTLICKTYKCDGVLLATKPSNRNAPPAATAAIISALQAISILVPTCLISTIDHNICTPEPDALGKAIIVRGTREKKCIVDTYKEPFGSDFDQSIASNKKGKIQQDPDFYLPCMKPALEKWHWISELSLLNVITMVVKEHHLLSCNLKNYACLTRTSPP